MGGEEGGKEGGERWKGEEGGREGGRSAPPNFPTFNLCPFVGIFDWGEQGRYKKIKIITII